MKTLILGGARSGKSSYAEKLVLDSKLNAVYIATATADDAEMEARIKQHQQQRGKQWLNIEEPIQLLKILEKNVSENNYVLVDCLTLWLTNLLLETKNKNPENQNPENQNQENKIKVIEKQLNEFCDSMLELDGDIVLVSNEIGLGIVPMGELSRQFCDLAGRLHQQLAAQCDQVIFMVAGIPQIIKKASPR